MLIEADSKDEERRRSNVDATEILQVVSKWPLTILWLPLAG